MLKSHGRYSYVPITQPNDARWPNGAGLAVYVACGIEEYNYAAGMTEDIIPGLLQPNLTNTSWRDYGNRVGGFRILQHCQALGVPLTVLINTDAYPSAPHLIAACRNAGYAMVAHGKTNSDSLADMDESQEFIYLKAVRDRMLQEGDTPAGWSSPWLAQTPHTLDLLQQSGYAYVLDLGLDDRAVWLRASGDRLLHIPYALELNDSSTAIGRMTSGRDFADMIEDAFDVLLAASERQPLVMSIVLHSFITGQPFRLRPVMSALQRIVAKGDKNIWLATTDEICRAVTDNPALAVA